MLDEIFDSLKEIKSYYGSWFNLISDLLLKYSIILFFLIFINFSESFYGEFALLLSLTGVLLNVYLSYDYNKHLSETPSHNDFI